MVCVVGPDTGALGAIDKEALRICDEDKHPFGRCVDVEHSQSISSRERGTTSQAFYRNGTKWRLEDQRGNCEEPVCRLPKPRLSMSILFGRGKHNDRFIESGHGNGRTRVKPGSAKVDIVAQGQIAW
jgi:hypothetical protein